jgi:SRSO17 transposase
MLAERRAIRGLGDSRPFLGHSQWDADELRGILRDCALETLPDDDTVLVIDETGFSKQKRGARGF